MQTRQGSGPAILTNTVNQSNTSTAARPTDRWALACSLAQRHSPAAVGLVLRCLGLAAWHSRANGRTLFDMHEACPRHISSIPKEPNPAPTPRPRSRQVVQWPAESWVSAPNRPPSNARPLAQFGSSDAAPSPSNDGMMLAERRRTQAPQGAPPNLARRTDPPVHNRTPHRAATPWESEHRVGPRER